MNVSHKRVLKMPVCQTLEQPFPLLCSHAGRSLTTCKQSQSVIFGTAPRMATHTCCFYNGSKWTDVQVKKSSLFDSFVCHFRKVIQAVISLLIIHGDLNRSTNESAVHIKIIIQKWFNIFPHKQRQTKH